MTDHEVADGTDEETGPDTDTDAEEAPAETTDVDTDADADAGGDAGGDETAETTGADATAGDGKTDADDKADDDADGAADGDDGPVDGKDRLEALQEDIDEVRRRVADPTDQGENTFIERARPTRTSPSTTPSPRPAETFSGIVFGPRGQRARTLCPAPREAPRSGRAEL